MLFCENCGARNYWHNHYYWFSYIFTGFLPKISFTHTNTTKNGHYPFITFNICGNWTFNWHRLNLQIDMETPVWPPVQSRSVLPPRFPTFHFTPTQFSSPHSRSQVNFASIPPGGTASFQPEPMQLCTSSEYGTPSSVAQRDLPNILPTPGRQIQQFTAQVKGN